MVLHAPELKVEALDDGSNSEGGAGPGKRRKPSKGAGRKAKATSSKALASAARVAGILELRIAGWSLAAIGASQMPSISAPRVHQILLEHLHDSVSEPTEEMRRLELARLDELHVGVYPQACNGDIFAIDRVLAIMARRASLLGLNAPTKVDVAGKDAGPIEHIVAIADAAASFDAKAFLALEKMRKAAGS